MLQAARIYFRQRIQNWVRRRQGPDGDVVILGQRRVYILPTRQGLLYSLTVFVMLLGSMNYSNSMGFLLTFVLTGLSFIAMHACHANLTGLEITAGKAPPVFAGEVARFHIHVTNGGRSARIAITLGAEISDTTVTGDVAAGERGSVAVPLPAETRGWLQLRRLAVESTYPFALFRAWSWVYMDLRALVYPKPAAAAPPLPPPLGGRGGDRHAEQSEEDFSGLRSYRPGDSPRHIAWRASARAQILLTKQFSGTGAENRRLDWNALTGLGQEERLSVLCRWVLTAHAQNLTYALSLPGREIPAGCGDVHRDHCLKVLALFGTSDGNSP